MRRKIYRRPQARLDLISIWHYIARDNPDAADQLLDRINDVLQRLAARPLIGRERTELGDKLRVLRRVVRRRRRAVILERHPATVRRRHPARDPLERRLEAAVAELETVRGEAGKVLAGEAVHVAHRHDTHAERGEEPVMRG